MDENGCSAHLQKTLPHHSEEEGQHDPNTTARKLQPGSDLQYPSQTKKTLDEMLRFTALHSVKSDFLSN